MSRLLAFDYPQEAMVHSVEDHMMLGEGCMIAPVYAQNTRDRYVYLPKDMLQARLHYAQDCDLAPMCEGHHYVELVLNEMPLFIRKGHFISLSRGGEWVYAVSFTEFTVLGWMQGNAQYDLYNDDVVSTQATLEDHITRMTVQGGEASCEGLTLDMGKLIPDCLLPTQKLPGGCRGVFHSAPTQLLSHTLISPSPLLAQA